MRALRPFLAGSALLLLTSMLAGCAAVTDVVGPGRTGLAPARLALSARLPVLAQAGVVTLRVAAAYEREDASLQPLGTQTLTLTDARAQDVPVAIDLGACLGDPLRRGGSGGGAASCAVRLTLTLLVDGRTVDEQPLGPFVLQPGATTPVVAPITLYELRNVRVDLPTGTVTRPDGSVRLEIGATVTLLATALDAAGQPVASRPAAWTSGTPAVATVGGATGTVTGVAAGRSRITAVLGGRESAVDVIVVPRPVPFTVAVAGTGSGSVTSTPAGLDCRAVAGAASGSCTASFPGDAQVTLVATADAGSAFSAWSDACATAGSATTCTLSADQARTVRATFGVLRRLTVAAAGDGSGTVASTPAGISCVLGATPGGSCAASFVDGSTVTLGASASAPDTFTGWGGDCAAAVGPTCTLTVGEATRSVTVRFVRPQTLSVGVSGTGDGTISGGGLSCVRRQDATTGTCSVTGAFGSTVTLSATPEPTSTFTGWTGACSGTGACVVTLDQVRAVGATFARRRGTVTAVVGGAGGGTLTVDGQRCTLAFGAGSATCTFQVDLGRPVGIAASPDSDSEFSAWSGVCAASGRTPACTVTLTEATATVGAVFVPLPVRVTIVSDTAAGASGSVSAGNGAIACTIQGAATTGTCSAVVPVGTTLTLSAAAAPGSYFSRWSGACSGAVACTVTVRGATVVGARFLRQQVPLTIGISGVGTGSVTVDGVVACTLTPGAGSVSCVRQVDVGAPVTLRLQPASGAIPSWGGPCAAFDVTAACTITPTGAVSVPVSFGVVGSVSVRPVAGYTGGGRIQSSDQRIDCTIAAVTGATSGICDVPYPAGTSVTLTLTTFTMSRFVGAWSGLCTSTTTTCTFTVPATGGTARITLPEFVSLAFGWSGAGSVATTFSDSTGQQPICSGVPAFFNCTATAPEGSTVTFTATSQFAGWFQGWTGACAAAGTAPVCTRTVPFRTPGTAAFTVRALFDFQAVVDVTGSGTISLQGRTGPGSACTNVGTGTTTCSLRSPTPSATFVPTPAAGNALTSWGTTACFTLTPTCTVEVSGANGRISATFQATAAALVTMNFNNTGSGTTTIAFADTTTQLSRCSTVSTNAYSCSGDVPGGSVVTFTAVSAFPNGFLGWTGDCASAGTALVCTRTVPLRTASNPPYVVGAQYDYGVPLGVSGGLGTVTLQSPSPGTTATCTNPGLSQTLCTLRSPTSTVTLVATPASGYAFVGWDAFACVSSGTTCTVDVGSSSRTNATFQATGPVGISFARDAAGAGTGRVITSFGTCNLPLSGPNGACNEVAQVGSTRTYTAQSTLGSVFVAWGGPCAGQTGTTCTLSPVTTGGVITLRFDQTPTQLLTVTGINSVDPGSGTVSSTPGGISCPMTGSATSGTCSGQFALGSNVTLTATPNANSIFVSWSGACSGTSPTCIVPMTGTQTASAFFQPALASLTLAFDPASSGWRYLSVSGQAIDCTSDPQINGGAPFGTGCTGAPVPNRSSITVVASGGGPGGPNSEFVGWSAGTPCAGVQSRTCTFTIDGNTAVRGRFGSLVFSSVALNNAGTTNAVVTVRNVRGTETFTVGGPNASVSNPRYFLGDSLTITASTTAPNQFSFWSGGACAAFGSNPSCTVIVTNGAEINAVFANAALRASAADAAPRRRRSPGQPAPSAPPRP